MRIGKRPLLVASALAGLLLVTGAGWRTAMAEPVCCTAAARVAVWPPAALAAEVLAVSPLAALAAEESAQPLVTPEPADATWTLTGHVCDDLGRPLAGATVSVGARRVAADAEGDFEMSGLPELDKKAQLSVVARADWHVAERLSVRGPTERAAAQPLRLQLDRGASLAGRVLGADGQAVAGARIVALHRGDAWEPRTPRGADEQCTGWDGRFLFECVEPGEWTVTAEAIGHVGQRVKLTLQPGDAASCEPLLLDEAASLDGRVLDRSGMPVAGAEVRFVWMGTDEAATASRAAPANPAAPDDGVPRHIVNVPYPRTSGADGRFRGTDLAPGLWRVVAIPPPGLLGPVPGVARLDFAPGETAVADVRFAEPRLLRGVVVDESGLPVAGLDVTAEELAPLDWRRIAPTARTDPLGRFSVEVAPDAEVSLSAEWQVRRLGVTQRVAPDAPEPVRLQLVSLDFDEAACGSSFDVCDDADSP